MWTLNRCRAKQRPPGSTCKPAPSRLLLVGASCGLSAGGNQMGTRRSRAVATRAGRSGGGRGLDGRLSRLVPRTGVAPLGRSLRRVVSGRPRPLRRVWAVRRRSSRLRRDFFDWVAHPRLRFERFLGWLSMGWTLHLQSTLQTRILLP